MVEYAFLIAFVALTALGSLSLLAPFVGRILTHI